MFGGTGSIVQSGWVVQDIDSALEAWLARGAGPFWLGRHITDIAFDYRGETTSLDLSVAWGQFGPIQIELIQQHGPGQSAFKDSYPMDAPAGLGGFHHMGLMNDNFDAAFTGCITQHLECALKGAFNGTRFAFMDTRVYYGFMIELTECTGSIRDFYAEIEAAATRWDGRMPIRPL